MLNYEQIVLGYSGLTEKIKSTFIEIEMDGVPFRVRTHTIEDKTSGKPTLVLMHGYLGTSTDWTKMLKPLREKYRIVLFDNVGFGTNTRLQECSGTESPEAAEIWLIEWLEKVFNTLDLPEKFHLVGHSAGGYLAALYASA